MVAFRAITQWTIDPGFKSFNPSSREIILQPGGKILETVTKLNGAIPAERKANSNEVKYSLWIPAPLVKKILVGNNLVILILKY